MYDIPCVIFAGGKSSRMGEDKALLPFDGFDTLTEFQLNKLSKIFKNVYISCKSKEKFGSLKENGQANFIEDVKTDNVYAPTAGFIAVYEKLACEKFFAISVDTPFINLEIISAIIDADKEESDATVASINSKIQPMCGIYHKSLLNPFKKMLEDNNHKLGFLLKSSNTKLVDFKDEKPFINLNNPNEYQEALKLLS